MNSRCTKKRCPMQHGYVPDDCDFKGCPYRTEQVDAVERKHGEWIDKGKNADKTYSMVCSECGAGFKTRSHAKSWNTKHKWNFCPTCGADMRGERCQ